MIVALPVNHYGVRKVLVLVIKRALTWMEAQTSYPSFIYNKTHFNS